jgi:L-tyrosine isonitrile synthase
MAEVHWEQLRGQRSRLRIQEAALTAFQRHGYDGATFRDIAAQAGVSVGLVCRYFPTKEHVALSLYDQLAGELAWIIPELPPGGIAERFEAVMRRKLALLSPRRHALVPLFGRALDPEARAGVLGDAAEGVRSKVAAVFRVVVDGATDAPGGGVAAAELAQVLYGLHLVLVLVWSQDRTDGAVLADSALQLVGELVRFGAPLLASPRLPRSIGERLHALSAGLLGVARADHGAQGLARRIVERIFRRRRSYGMIGGEPSAAALAPHVARVVDFVTRGEPVELVLPAFPAKSPNATKVLGALPDLGETIALRSLAALCAEIAELYPAGARMILCSDGHVFADAVGVPDKQVARYRAALEELVAEVGEGRIRIFGLEDAFDERPAEARRHLLARYARGVEEVRAQADASAAHRTQLEGIHRFLTEDEQGMHPGMSRSQAQKVTRARAYEVVRRSDAWGRLVAAVFPRAVRLSIHPQPEVSDKIGIHLVPTEDAWLTPWHGCVLVAGDHIELVKRHVGEARGGRLIEHAGRASHLELPT